MRYRIAPHLAFMIQWLRVLGFDVKTWEKKELLDPLHDALIQWEPYPLPLPRKGRGLTVITLSGATLPQLLKEFLEQSGQQPDPEKMFGRCLRCNTPLIPLPPDTVKALWPELPEYVYRTQKRFNRCPTCGKFFWEGTHVRNMRRTLSDWGVLPKETGVE